MNKHRGSPNVSPVPNILHHGKKILSKLSGPSLRHPLKFFHAENSVKNRQKINLGSKGAKKVTLDTKR